MTADSEFESQEAECLKELKERMKGEMEPEMYEDNHLFYRFLKARDFNVNNAESMLRKHLKWLQDNDVKNIQKFKKLEVMEKYIPNIIIGHDKEGCTIRYCPVGNLDLIGLGMSCKNEEICKFMISETEIETRDLKSQSEKLGKNIDQCVYIHNLENFSFAQATDKKVLYHLLFLVNMFQNNYPERLKAAYVLNASLYFTFLFSVLKSVLAKSILQKIRIYSDDSYKEDLVKVIDDDVLPAFLGGTRTDPDGNPLCLSFINHGGPIPESYYIHRTKKSLSKSPDVKKVTLPRAAFHELNLEVEEPESFLEWEFETKCRDIGFGLFYQEVLNGEETNTEIIPIHRIDTNDYAETGTFKCDKAGSYVLVFDNTYSWIREKEIFYRLKVVSPKEHEAEMAS